MKTKEEIQNRLNLFKKNTKVAIVRPESEVDDFSFEMLSFIFSFYTEEEFIASDELCDEFNNLIYEYKNYIPVNNWKEKLFSKFGPAEQLICYICSKL